MRVQIRYVHEAYDNNRHKQIQTVGSDTTTAETNRQTQSDQHQVTEGVERMTKAEIADSDRPKLTHRREVVGRGGRQQQTHGHRHTDKHQLTVGAHDNRDRHRKTHRWAGVTTTRETNNTDTDRPTQ